MDLGFVLFFIRVLNIKCHEVFAHVKATEILKKKVVCSLNILHILVYILGIWHYFPVTSCNDLTMDLFYLPLPF